MEYTANQNNIVSSVSAELEEEQKIPLSYFYIRLLKILIGINFFWFGILKFFPNASPAEALAIKTIHFITFGLMPDSLAINLLAIWEVTLALGFFTDKWPRFFLNFFLLHMFFTFFPLFLFPEICFVDAPFKPTMVGQYILKNIVFIGVGLLAYQAIVLKDKGLRRKR